MRGKFWGHYRKEKISRRRRRTVRSKFNAFLCIPQRVNSDSIVGPNHVLSWYLLCMLVFLFRFQLVIFTTFWSLSFKTSACLLSLDILASFHQPDGFWNLVSFGCPYISCVCEESLFSGIECLEEHAGLLEHSYHAMFQLQQLISDSFPICKLTRLRCLTDMTRFVIRSPNSTRMYARYRLLFLH